MKKTIMNLILLLLSVYVFAQAPDWQWATKAGGGFYDVGNSIAIDEAGNSYVTGYFEDTATFGTTSLTSSGGHDIFVAKMDADGKWLWATKAGGNSTDSGNSIALDEAGNSYVTGSFHDTVTFGTTSLTSSGSWDIFVAKMDAAGNWLWATKVGGTDYDGAYSITLDEAGNSYVTGYFYNTATFGTISLTGSGSYDIFVAKMDAAGNWQWATKAGGSSDDYGYSIALDEAGNSYVTGWFRDTATFGATSLTSSGDYDIFVAKMDAYGNWLWATKVGGTDDDEGRSITLDEAGNSYVTGRFKDTATFGTTSLTSNGSNDIFVAKMDANGNWLWATKAGGTSADAGYSIALDEAGNSYVVGYFNDTATFGTTSLTSSGGGDIFVAKLRGDFIADFEADTTSGDLPLVVNFTDLSSIIITSWEWDFDNDGTIDSNEQNPSWTYYEAGVYTVSLTVSDGVNFVSETKTDYITVTVNPDPTITIDPESLEFGNVCINETATLPITVHNYGQQDLEVSNIMASTDRFSVSLPNRDISFTIAPLGTQIVNVSFSPTALEETTGNLYFLSNDPDNSMLSYPVSGTGYNFEVDFSVNETNGDAPLEVQFTDTSIGDIQNWNWQFGDGETSTAQNPLHTYDFEGIYTVTLTVEDNYFQKSVTQENLITVIGHPIISSPDSLGINFGSLYLTDSSGDSLIVIQNTGTKAFQINGLSFVEATGGFNFTYENIGVPIMPNESDTIFVNFFPPEVGSYEDHILITNTSENLPNLELSLTGVCEYAPPKIPENIAVNVVYPDAIITWDAVTENIYNFPLTPDGYLVYFSSNPGANDDNYFFLAFTTGLSYTHEFVAQYSPYMFYKVIATVDLSRSEIAYLSNLNNSQKKIKLTDLEQTLKSLKKNDSK